ncbi:hypothetical protein D3C87_2106210 [compost metagenome]
MQSVWVIDTRTDRLPAEPAIMGDKRQTVSAHHQSVFGVQEENIEQRFVWAIVHELLCLS